LAEQLVSWQDPCGSDPRLVQLRMPRGKRKINGKSVGQECPTHTSHCPLLALSPMLNIERFARWPQPLSGQPES